MLKHSGKILLSLFILQTSLLSFANPSLSKPFSLVNYNQTVSHWLKPTDLHYDKALLDGNLQRQHFKLFYDHYFGSLSPWNPNYIKLVLKQAAPNDLKTIEQSLINNFSNQNKEPNKIGHGINFQPYTTKWLAAIINNISLTQLTNLSYQTNNRAIAIDNLYARALPTEDVHFYNPQLAGEGYPFDNLQMSALWIGTPLYILSTTRDRIWSLVLTPDYIAWVKSSGIARADDHFISKWQATAQNNLAAITQAKIILTAKQNYAQATYIGSVFPGIPEKTGFKLLVPVSDTNHQAMMKEVHVSAKEAALMPLAATPHQFANIMNNIIDRPYGWGGMYFYNDCSAELKSLFTPFGIWLPRYSADQAKVGKMVDLSSLSATQKISYLREHGQPLLSIVYIGGHVVLYVGNYPSSNPNEASTIMTYQNVWGLSPNPPTQRAVIGKSVFLPMLLQYPEDANLISMADKKYFQIVHLNQPPANNKPIDLKSLMFAHSLD